MDLITYCALVYTMIVIVAGAINTFDPYYQELTDILS